MIKLSKTFLTLLLNFKILKFNNKKILNFFKILKFKNLINLNLQLTRRSKENFLNLHYYIDLDRINYNSTFFYKRGRLQERN